MKVSAAKPSFSNKLYGKGKMLFRRGVGFAGLFLS